MIVVVADDITGAVELAGIGWRYGLRVALQRDLRAPPPATDLLVLDTDSRSLTRAEAQQRMALAAAGAKHAAWVYKKVDSVLRGHVRAECTELASALGKTAVRLCPVNPSLGRTIADGRLQVAGVPLQATAFAHDPEWPATTDRVEELLARSSGWPCRTGAAATGTPESELAAGDVTAAADLQHWAATVDPTVLPAGGGDFFEALLQQHGFRESLRPQWTCPPGPCLLVCGSAATSSRAVVDRLAQAGRTICNMPAELFATPADSPDALARWAADLSATLRREGQAVLAIRHPVQAEAAVARRLAAACAAAVRQALRSARIRVLLVEGGATAAALLAAMDDVRWELAGELQRGVGVLHAAEHPLDLVLKPGSYAWPEGLLENG